jgi:hypothetical protein
MVLVGEPGFVSSQPGFDPPQQGQNTENQGVSYTELTVPSRCMVRARLLIMATGPPWLG